MTLLQSHSLETDSSTTQSKASASSSLLVARPAGVPLASGVQASAPGVAAYLSSLQAAAAAVAAANASKQQAKPLPSPKPAAKPVALLPAGQAAQAAQPAAAKAGQPASTQQQQQQMQQLQQLQKLQQLQQQQAKIKLQQQEQQRIQQQQAQAHVRAITGAASSSAAPAQAGTSGVAQTPAVQSFVQSQTPKRADLTVGTTVLIRVDTLLRGIAGLQKLTFLFVAGRTPQTWSRAVPEISLAKW